MDCGHIVWSGYHRKSCQLWNIPCCITLHTLHMKLVYAFRDNLTQTRYKINISCIFISNSCVITYLQFSVNAQYSLHCGPAHQPLKKKHNNFIIFRSSPDKFNVAWLSLVPASFSSLFTGNTLCLYSDPASQNVWVSSKAELIQQVSSLLVILSSVSPWAQNYLTCIIPSPLLELQNIWAPFKPKTTWKGSRPYVFDIF